VNAPLPAGAEPMPAAVLFDLDGTLADSRPIVAGALAAAYAAAGGEGDPPLAEFESMSGRPLPEIVTELGLPAVAVAAYEAAALRLLEKARLFEGIMPLLRSLRSRETPVGVITGKGRARTEATLDHLGIADLIQASVTPDDPPEAKPSPQGVWWLCDRLKVPVHQAVLVGDSVTDMVAGDRAGVRTVACLWGVGRAQDLTRCRPWRTVTSVAELSALLLASPAVAPTLTSPQSCPPRSATSDRGPTDSTS
jgi:phosphoglycolate phosphatase/AHBA synthesis associated protein